MDKILQMLELQQQLNDATNGEGWEKGVTKNGKIIDWKRCSYLECAELIESYPWKHWKNIDAQPDYANIKIEAVDIWHFIMSQGLEDYKMQNLGSIENLAQNINKLPNFSTFLVPIAPAWECLYSIIEEWESFFYCILGMRYHRGRMGTRKDRWERVKVPNSEQIVKLRMEEYDKTLAKACSSS